MLRVSFSLANGFQKQARWEGDWDESELKELDTASLTRFLNESHLLGPKWNEFFVSPSLEAELTGMSHCLMVDSH